MRGVSDEHPARAAQARRSRGVLLAARGALGGECATSCRRAALLIRAPISVVKALSAKPRSLKADHRGSPGASLANTARGTPRVWRTCGTLAVSLEPERAVSTKGLRQASMSRGVEARGSNWTPDVPRALRFFSGRLRTRNAGGSRRLIQKSGRRSVGLPRRSASEGGLFEKKSVTQRLTKAYRFAAM